MIAEEIPDDVLERALALAELTYSIGPRNVAQMFGPWVREDADAAAQVLVALALIADRDKVTKEGHAAYGRGSRSALVCDLERRYQRESKRKRSRYLSAVNDDGT